MKLLGNRIMIERVEESFSASGFELVDPYNRGQIIFNVLAVGPGRWLRHPKKQKSVFIKPECEVGQQVLSDHWFSAAVHPTWHQPEFLDHTDGRGRVILDARFCLAAWWPPVQPPKPLPYKSSSHL